MEDVRLIVDGVVLAADALLGLRPVAPVLVVVDLRSNELIYLYFY